MAILRPFLSILLFVMFVLCGQASANSLEDIRFSELPGNRFEVRVDFSEAPSKPRGYTIEKPARIVLDFVDVDNQLTEKKFPLSFDNAQNAVVLSSKGRTRLTINLNNPATYSTEVRDNSLIVTVDAATADAIVEEANDAFGINMELFKELEGNLVKAIGVMLFNSLTGGRRRGSTELVTEG